MKKIGVTGLVLLLAASALCHAQATQPTVPKGVSVTLSDGKHAYFLGENVLLDYEVKNASDQTVTVTTGGDYRGSPRHLRIQVLVTDAEGKEMSDPTPHPMCMGGIYGPTAVKPGESFFISVPIMRYRNLPKGGKYTVKVAHDLGWGKENGKIAPGDPRWASAQIEMSMPNPDQAAAVVEAMAKLKEPSARQGKKREPYADFTCLRYPVYLPALNRLAAKGDLRATQALGAMPDPESTRSLVDLLGSPVEGVAAAAAKALAYRLPNPDVTEETFKGPWESQAQHDEQKEFIRLSWRDEFREAIVAYAQKALARTPADGMNDREMEGACFLV